MRGFSYFLDFILFLGRYKKRFSRVLIVLSQELGYKVRVQFSFFDFYDFGKDILILQYLGDEFGKWKVIEFFLLGCIEGGIGGCFVVFSIVFGLEV